VERYQFPTRGKSKGQEDLCTEELLLNTRRIPEETQHDGTSAYLHRYPLWSPHMTPSILLMRLGLILRLGHRPDPGVMHLQPFWAAKFGKSAFFVPRFSLRTPHA
jgi:hypothetical protein